MDAPFRRQHDDHYEIVHLRARKTFREAAESFVANGGSGRHLPRVVEYFGDRLLTEIVPFDIREMALALYPHQKNATRNRQARDFSARIRAPFIGSQRRTRA